VGSAVHVFRTQPLLPGRAPASVARTEDARFCVSGTREREVAQYDPKIIQDHADQLYSQADKAPLLTAYAAGLVGLVSGLGSGMGLDVGTFGGIVVGLVLAVLASAVGYMVGKSQAAKMRVTAQTALCQVAIEGAVNSRGEAPGGESAAG